MKAFIALLKIDLKLAARNRAVLFYNYLFPLIFFFAFAQMFSAHQGSAIIQVVAMVVVLGIIGNGLFGAGMRAVQEREENVLRRYKVTPITPVPLLSASMITGVVLYLPSVLLMLVLANQLYGMAMPHNLVALFVFVCLGAIAFRSLGMIIAAVVNSSQESNILIQPIYMTMLFLSGATIPITFMPHWLQDVTQFVPATYLMTGIGGILQRGESLGANWQAIAALVVTTVVATFIATKLFRWEKGEKLRASAKLWVLVVLLPFLCLGAYQAWSQHDLVKARILARDLHRGHTWLIQNARIFVGNGQVIESGAVLVRRGKIVQVFNGAAPDPKSLNADVIDAAGKTVLPGLIDVHVHLGGPGGFYDDMSKFDPEKSYDHELESYLYCGVTAVRSAGDQVDPMLKLRQRFNGGEMLGSELYLCGPLFTAEGGHGTEYAKNMPEVMRENFKAQFLRIPKSQPEARKMVDDLAAKGVNAIKGILEAGVPGYTFNRMNLDLLRAVVEEAHAKHLPVSVHTGDARDVTDAVSLGVDSIEHGSFRDDLPETTIAEMKTKGVAYDPTLSVAEGLTDFAKGNGELLKRSLVQQVTPKDLLAGTEHALTNAAMKKMRDGLAHYPMSVAQGDRNLLNVWHAGVMLVTGSDAGNPLVLHGPTVQREVELWVQAGIPPAVALQAATSNAAKLLRADQRIGTIEVGKEATLVIVDGNPLQDVHALSSISMVMLKGERVGRAELFDQE
ncbi:MAG TPA: amidohydrolase family protein [Chthoniobacterales bacterium]|nr:amidohydrolase family protein [Chthoniobacterales bacterium]